MTRKSGLYCEKETEINPHDADVNEDGWNLAADTCRPNTASGEDE